jgi:His/Glu/Gln/Arg/opine family amino acid ABC transporter permease subunit
MLDFSLMLSSVPRLCESLPVTLELFFTVVVVGLVIGIGLAFISTLQSRVCNSLITGYIAIFRGTPALVQLFFVYYGLGQFEFIRESFVWPVFRDPFPCAVIALGMNSGAYTANILMGALSAVPKGLVEGAQALGLSKTATLFRIKAPLAVRIAIPAYTNETILNLKATSLASTVTIMELTGTSRLLVSDTYAPYEIFLTAGLIYLLMTYIVAYIFRGIEQYIDRKTGRTFAGLAKLDKAKAPVILKGTSS